MRISDRNVGKRLPFFLPGRLIEFEYFSNDTDPGDEKLVTSYRKELDFAFFAVNFGYSKADYEMLTPKEKAFIYKAWEDKIVGESYRFYNAAFTAAYNVNRPKRKRALSLWKKKKVQKANTEIVFENLKIVKEVEEKEGKGWVDIIYKKNGLRRPKEVKKIG